jgi:hypothetical protein
MAAYYYALPEVRSPHKERAGSARALASRAQAHLDAFLGALIDGSWAAPIARGAYIRSVAWSSPGARRTTAPGEPGRAWTRRPRRQTAAKCCTRSAPRGCNFA